MNYYVGHCPACGSVRAVCVDKPEYLQQTAKDVAAWKRSGVRVEHVTSDVGVVIQSCADDCEWRNGKRRQFTAQASLEIPPRASSETKEPQ